MVRLWQRRKYEGRLRENLLGFEFLFLVVLNVKPNSSSWVPCDSSYHIFVKCLFLCHLDWVEILFFSTKSLNTKMNLFYYFRPGALFSLGISWSIKIGWQMCIIIIKITHFQTTLESALYDRDITYFSNCDNSMNLPRDWICIAQHHLSMSIWGTISYIYSITEK